MNAPHARTRYACYMSNVSMSVISILTPLLLITFRQLYGISYTRLGLLALVNFCTQLAVDLLFSFFSHRFNIRKTVRLMPLLTVLGLAVYAILPACFPGRAFLFLLAGTVIFSAAAGLAEVLISPIIAALPSDDPARDMSRTHSVYAWGVVAAVLVSTLFLQLFGRESWHALALLWALVPLSAFLLFLRAPIPPLASPGNTAGAGRLLRNPVLLLCVCCIFLGGAAEVTMSQWCSGYLEAALGLPKLLGDLLGVAVFAAMLGLGRTLYAHRGGRIARVLLLSFAGAAVCYLAAAFSPSPVVGLVACGMTGLCVSMLWPGTLILTAGLLPGAGVAVYALLAAGGDLGAAVTPQLVGSITDAVAASGVPEQLGFKLGMLAAALFPLLGTLVASLLLRAERRKSAAREAPSPRGE